MRTRNTNKTRVYRILQWLADFTLGILCAAGLGMAMIFACYWL